MCGMRMTGLSLGMRVFAIVRVGSVFRMRVIVSVRMGCVHMFVLMMNMFVRMLVRVAVGVRAVPIVRSDGR